jgi:predicted nucleic acid-binding protein
VICVDSSVAAKWLFAEVYSAEADELLRTALDQQEPIVAPPLLPAEVTNIIRQRLRQAQLRLDEGRELLVQFMALPIAFQAPQMLYDRVLVLTEQYNLPAVYDANYLALAEMLGATLWTADQRLLRALGGRLAFVRSIADYGA